MVSLEIKSSLSVNLCLSTPEIKYICLYVSRSGVAPKALIWPGQRGRPDRPLGRLAPPLFRQTKTPENPQAGGAEPTSLLRFFSPPPSAPASLGGGLRAAKPVMVPRPGIKRLRKALPGFQREIQSISTRAKRQGSLVSPS